MDIDIKRIEELIYRDSKNKKQYESLFFIYEKTKYHATNFKKFYPQLKNRYNKFDREAGKQIIDNVFVSISNLLHTNPKIFQDSKRTMNVKIQRKKQDEPIYFEFDSILIDSRRVIEYFIKLLANLMNQTKPDKIDPFFNGLLKQTKPRSNFCLYLEKNYPEYFQYLVQSWKNWIKDLNQYRTNTMHKSIKIHPTTKIVLRYDPNNKEPRQIDSSEILFQEKEMEKYIDDLFNNLTEFLKQGFTLIQNNLC